MLTFGSKTTRPLSTHGLRSARRVFTMFNRAAPGAPRLIYFHGMFNGEGFVSWQLAQLFEGRVAFSVMQPHGFDGGPVPPTVEAMADHYVNVIRRYQPHGPYHLAGFCVGGMVALEVARRLRGSGEAVHEVILISAYVHRRPLQRTRVLVKNYLTPRLANHLPKLMSFLRRLSGSARRDERKRRNIALNDAYNLAGARYRPQPYDGRLTLIHGREDRELQLPALHDWRRTAVMFQSFAVPGSHHCIETSTNEIGEIILERLFA